MESTEGKEFFDQRDLDIKISVRNKTISIIHTSSGMIKYMKWKEYEEFPLYSLEKNIAYMIREMKKEYDKVIKIKGVDE